VPAFFSSPRLIGRLGPKLSVWSPMRLVFHLSVRFTPFSPVAPSFVSYHEGAKNTSSIATNTLVSYMIFESPSRVKSPALRLVTC
jgi:hypothetical protein